MGVITAPTHQRPRGLKRTIHTKAQPYSSILEALTKPLPGRGPGLALLLLRKVHHSDAGAWVQIPAWPPAVRFGARLSISTLSPGSSSTKQEIVATLKKKAVPQFLKKVVQSYHRTQQFHS